LLAVALGSGVAAAVGAPVLRSVAVADGHLVVRFTLSPDLVSRQVVAATSRAALVTPSSSSVKLREVMHTSPDPVTGVARWRTRGTLPAGIYYVEVSGIVTVGVTDCTPRRANCSVRWSKPLRVVVP